MATTAPVMVQSPLNLILTVKPGQIPVLQKMLADNQAINDAALTKVGTVHFARFLFVPGTNYLFVITEFDGDFATYIQAFTNILGDLFNVLLANVDPAPPLPVQQNMPAFQAFVAKYNVPSGLYSAYPQCTVMDIWGNGCAQP